MSLGQYPEGCYYLSTWQRSHVTSWYHFPELHNCPWFLTFPVPNCVPIVKTTKPLIIAKLCGLAFGHSEDKKREGFIRLYSRLEYRSQGGDCKVNRMREKQAESLGITEMGAGVGEEKSRRSQTSQRGKEI